MREIHAFHEDKRHHLRSQHGQIYDEFELVKSELDSLADELLHLSDHGVALDANFSKFGYDAHISEDEGRFRAERNMLIHGGVGTRDPDSSTNSLSGDRSSSHRDWDAERRNGQALKFWRKPTVRQYLLDDEILRSLSQQADSSVLASRSPLASIGSRGS